MKTLHHSPTLFCLGRVLLPLALVSGCESAPPPKPRDVILVSGCEPAPPPPKPRDVFLVSIDTLRHDHLGCYGYPRGITPNIDAFRNDAVLFEQAIAQASSTLSSHASMLTGRIPPHHGASYGLTRKVAPEVRTITEILHQTGYAAASFNNGGQLDSSFGLDRGFDRYRVIAQDSFQRVAHFGVEWLDETPEPAFLFLHTYEVHHPYNPQPRFLQALSRGYDGPLPAEISIDLLQRINRGEVTLNDRDRRYIIDTYDAGIASMDQAFGLLLEALKKRGRYRDSLIVFTSDHGEEFGEHGMMGWHSHTLYDELLRVPLLIKLPGNHFAGTTVPQQVRLLDLPTTITDLLRLPPVASFDGRSLLPLIQGCEESESEDGVPLRPAMSAIDRKEQPPILSLRIEGWKRYHQQLYDLKQDPDERINLIDPERRQWHALDEILTGLVAARSAAEAEETPLSEEARERLRALGYVD